MEFSVLARSFNRIIAVRPNLNRKGYLTIHEVGPRGGVDYSHALCHTDSTLHLRDVCRHVAPGAAKRAKEGKKIPCASLIGILTNQSQRRWNGEPAVRYNPKNGKGFEFEFDPVGKEVCCTYAKCFLARNNS